MSDVSIETSQNVSIDYNLATVGDRILEGLIDCAIVIVYFVIVLLVMSSMDFFDHFQGIFIMLFIVLLLPGLAYSLLCETFLNGQTFGKKAMKTRVIRLNGTQPNLGDYVLRWLFRIVDVWLGNAMIGLLSILLSRYGQRLGDMVAGTTVVRIGRKLSLSDTIFSESEVNYTPVFYQAAQLHDEHAALIREVLNAYYRDNNYTVVEALTAKLKSILDINSAMPPLDFLNTILRDYGHLTDNMGIKSYQ